MKLKDFMRNSVRTGTLRWDKPPVSSQDTVVIIGMAPLPFEEARMHNALGRRTWQFAKAVSDGGYDVSLICSRSAASYDDCPSTGYIELNPRFRVYFVREDRFSLKDIASALGKAAPRAVVGVNVYSALAACRIAAGRIPVWADLNGHFMTEAQAKCANYSSDRYIRHFWRYEREVLRKADVFSVVSDAQRHATLGELGTQGRLNSRTFGYDLVRTIRNAAELGAEGIKTRGGSGDEFVVLWSGSYNNWADPDTLVKGVEIAMEKIPRLKFVSTGGSVKGHDENTYWRVMGLVNNSRFKERFDLRGWVDRKELEKIYEETDIAVLSEYDTYEGLLGCRNRVLEWVTAGIPVIMNRVSELSALLDEREAVLTYRCSDPRDLAEKIFYFYGNREEMGRYAERAAEYAKKELSPGLTMQPVLEWLDEPRRAPDLVGKKA
ncbi:MAG: glycosyltransferase family 4 protein [Elusimicrobia bacterium]|nr:glycosyltransferase family 4 protein [Elusimicrobiota bacterium]